MKMHLDLMKIKEEETHLILDSVCLMISSVNLARQITMVMVIPWSKKVFNWH